MIFVDSGYFIALANERDELHERAIQWAKTPGPLLVTEYVLWETVNYLSAAPDRARAHNLLDDVRTSDACEIVPASLWLFESGLSLHKRRVDKNWSLTDCISFCVMRDRGIHLALSHDVHFEQAGFIALLRREP